MNLNKFRYYLQLEATSGFFLFFAALCALIIANSPYFSIFEALFALPIGFNIDGYYFAKPVHFWINDCLMAIFFLMIGLELKRECIEGELNDIPKIILPGIAALGGMIVPALIYFIINYNTVLTLKGWPIPVATDIAFALGVLSLLGKKVPVGLKLFLMTLAIFDDLGAIIIIAIFYTQALSFFYLCLSGVVLVLLWIIRRLGVSALIVYWILGLFLWICIFKSGVHATIAGVLFAFMVPIKKKSDERLSPLHRLEDQLHPWVAYLILPLFAFTNAGLSFHDVSWEKLISPLVLGTMAGLFLGKQMGVFLFVRVALQFKFAHLPDKTSWLQLYGVALLCGIGFTMSLFLGTLAFEDIHPEYLMDVRLGVFVGSFLSGLMGFIVLHIAFKNKRKRFSR